jgi:hypothetical protein
MRTLQQALFATMAIVLTLASLLAQPAAALSVVHNHNDTLVQI